MMDLVAGSVEPSRRVRRRVRGGSHLRSPRDRRQLGPSVLSFERSDDKTESIIVIVVTENMLLYTSKYIAQL